MDALHNGTYTKELIKEGTGATVQSGQTITVHCTGYGSLNLNLISEP